MTESNSSSAVLPIAFLADVERLLTPFYAECFTDETRKVRNLLLAASLVLILFVLGFVAPDAAVRLAPLPPDITVTGGLRWILMALAAYFLIILAARSAIEWRFWRLRHQAALVGLESLNTSALSCVAIINSAGAELAASIEVFRRGNERLAAIERRQSAEPIQARRDASHRQSEQLLAEVSLALPKTREQTQLRNHYDEVCDELEELDSQLHQELEKREKQAAEERETLNRQLEEAEDDYQRRITAAEVQTSEAEIHYLRHKIHPLSGILTLRQFFEMLFPIVFGLFALIFGLIARRA